jgi:Ice-binding-like
MKIRRYRARFPLSAGIAVALVIGMLAAAPAYAAGPTAVGLGTASSFAVLAGTGITNTGTTTINGDVGSYPTATETGFSGCPAADCVNLTGTNHAGDAVTQGAKSALGTAYTDAAGRTPVTQTTNILGGKTLVGGVYNSGSAAFDLTGTLTLDGGGDPNSVWIFQGTSSITTASASSVVFINGGQPCNVFWQITSTAVLGSGSTFAGTIMASTSITIASGVTLNGRALASTGDVTLISDTITESTCAAAPGPTPTPGATRTSAGSSTTPAPTSTVGDRPSSSPTPLFELMILLALSAFGLAAFVTQRRSIRR